MSHGDHREEYDSPDHAHTFEPSDTDGRSILIFGVIGVVVLVATVGLIQLYFAWAHGNEVESQVLLPPSTELRNMRAREEKDLTTYGYTDQTRTVVRLPIERSMELLAQEAAQNKLTYPQTPYKVKTPEELAAGAATGQQAPAPAQATGNPVNTQGGSAAQAGHAAPTPPAPGMKP